MELHGDVIYDGNELLTQIFNDLKVFNNLSFYKTVPVLL